jgi:hypothetical protein
MKYYMFIIIIKCRLFFGLPADARVRSQVSPCGISIRQSGTGIGLSPSISVSAVCVVPPALRSHS